MSKQLKDLIEKEDGDFHFTAWIPSINSQLNFSLIKPGISGKYLTPINKRDISSAVYTRKEDGARHSTPDRHFKNIAIQSCVNWQDLLEGDGRFRVVMLGSVNHAESMEERSLQGCIIIYPEEYEKEKNDKNDDKVFLEKFALKQSIEVLDKILEPPKINFWYQLQFWKSLRTDEPENLNTKWKTKQEELDQQWKQIVDKIPASNQQLPTTKNEYYRIDYKVSVDGLCFLKFISFNENQEASNHQDDQHSVEMDANAENDIYIICRQAYYYLKYSIHLHRHHENDYDAMTTIVKNNKHYPLKLIAQIKRAITDNERSVIIGDKRNTVHLIESKGLIAYAKSLCVTLYKKGCIDAKMFSNEIQGFDNWNASLSALIEVASFNSNQPDKIVQFRRYWITVTLTVISLCILVANIIYDIPKIDIPTYIKNAVETGYVFYIIFIPLIVYILVNKLTKEGFKSLLNYIQSSQHGILNIIMFWLVALLISALLLYVSFFILPQYF